MKIEKNHWHTNGDSLSLSVPFQKVDQEKRTVSGFATLDNVDRQDDIVSYEASVKAFDTFRGNLREMHAPVAVGKVLSFSQEAYYDPTTSKMYSGIYVTAYVSKGAQDTWEKVLDGTLSGFSIGAQIKDADVYYDAEMDKTIRVVTDYEMVELSLVDSPANQLANVLSVVKVKDGVVTGMAVDTKTLNVFYCENDSVAKTSDSESAECVSCGCQMNNIGWIEDVASANEKVLAIKAVMASMHNDSLPDSVSELTQVEKNIGEGGNEMDTEIVEKADVVEEVVSDEVVVEEKAAEVSEVDESGEPDLVKSLDDLRAYVNDVAAKALSADRLAEVITTIDELQKSVESRFEAFEAKYEDLSKSVGALNEGVERVEKGLAAIDKQAAVQKSADLGGSEETITKSEQTGVWGGRFLSTRDI